MDVITDAWTSDVGTSEDLAEAVASRVEQSWDSGADVVLFPEYTWAALHSEPAGVAEVFQKHVLPQLQSRLTRPGKLAVLGSSLVSDESTGHLRNRAMIMTDGVWLAQDKLFMTPWEGAFQGGDVLQVFKFQGLRIAVIICLDIEVPELSVLLRGQGIDLILVPSATETMQGVERVTRCASARAVELGCAVVVSPLVGECASDLVDENLGKLACYLPSQRAFKNSPCVQESDVFNEGFHCSRFTLPLSRLTSMRRSTVETNPSLLLDVSAKLPRLTFD
jgi:predicted amidohydrolase